MISYTTDAARTAETCIFMMTTVRILQHTTNVNKDK